MYYTGTISTVSGSAIVRGTGTQFIANINGVAPGQIILIRSGNNNLNYMIQAVNSDTELVLADTVPVTLNNVKYQIQTTVPDSVSDGVRHIVANTSYITLFLQNMDKWMSQNGVVDVTLPNGQTVSLQSIQALYENITQLNQSIDNRLEKSQNGADIPNKQEFVKNLGLSDTVELARDAASLTHTGHQTFAGDIYANAIISGKSQDDRTWLSADDNQITWNSNVGNDFYVLKHPMKNGVLATLADLGPYALQRNIAVNTALKSSRGWWKCGDTGLMFQWGYTDGALGESREWINFSVPFSTVCIGG